MPPITVTYVTPSATPYSLTFQNANLAYHYSTADSNRWYFADAASTKFIQCGSLLPDPDPMWADTSYNVPGYDEIHYPFTMNDSYDQTFITEDHFNGGVYSNGDSVHVTADGYGTLILPNYTFTNALRVQTQLKFEIFAGTWWNELLYSFYVPGQPGWVCMYGFLTDSVYNPINNTSAPEYLLSIVNGIGNTGSATQFKLLTNQPGHEFQYMCSNDFIGKAIEVKNILGQTVASKIISSSDESINLSQLQAGTYFLTVSGSTKMISEKIIVQ